MHLYEVFHQHLEYLNLSNKNLKGNLYTTKEKYGWAKSYRGSIDIQNNQLDSLAGAPDIVIGSFIVANNKLTSLEFSPDSIGKHFNVSHNNITNIKYLPKFIGGDCNLQQNDISSLENIESYCSTIRGKLMLTGNPIKEKISGLLRINDLKEVVYSGPNTRAVTAFNELNKRLNLTESLIADFSKVMKKLGLDEFI